MKHKGKIKCTFEEIKSKGNLAFPATHFKMCLLSFKQIKSGMK